MTRRHSVNLTAMSAALAVGLGISASALAAEAYEYLPAQAFTHEAGGNAISGYYLARNGRCNVTVTMGAASPVLAKTAPPMRISFRLRPYETVSIGTTEDPGIHLTCGSMARHLIVTADAPGAYRIVTASAG
jgi:hypothetical protein